MNKLSTMLPASKLKIIQDLIASSSKEELVWINGYISGVLSAGADQATEAVTSQTSYQQDHYCLWY